MKKLLTLAWVGFLLTGIAALFWYNEWVYQLPTPMPINYTAIPAGKLIPLPPTMLIDSSKPVFLHFFNPDCPCSRFNITHFKSLVREYGRQVNFIMVVMNNNKYSVNQIQDKYGINVPVILDTTLARVCGVYSTPQAVILNNKNELYYRGNYNKNRYCTDKKSNYAQIALNALLQHTPDVFFDRYALTAYGCQLPQCTKN